MTLGELPVGRWFTFPPWAWGSGSIWLKTDMTRKDECLIVGLVTGESVYVHEDEKVFPNRTKGGET